MAGLGRWAMMEMMKEAGRWKEGEDWGLEMGDGGMGDGVCT